jgi:hypothetical protein
MRLIRRLLRGTVGSFGVTAVLGKQERSFGLRLRSSLIPNVLERTFGRWEPEYKRLLYRFLPMTRCSGITWCHDRVGRAVGVVSIPF